MQFQLAAVVTSSKTILLTLGALGAIFALTAGCAMPAGDSEPDDEAEIVGTAEEAVSTTAVWKGDVQVKISAVKSASDETITYTITAKNLGDDDARNVVISHTPNYFDGLDGMSFLSVTGSKATCTGQIILIGASVTCTPITLGVGVTETVTVVISNPANTPRTGTAQAMGITPDPVPSNNFASIAVP